MRIDLDPVHGAGGGGKAGGSGAGEDPNTLISISKARFLDIMGEGPIGGLINGEQSIIINKVPYKNPDGTYNFKGLRWEFRAGNSDQDPTSIVPGISTEYEVGIKVRNDTPCTYRTQGTGLDRVVVTMQTPAMTFLDKDSGALHGTTVEIAIDIKSVSGPTNTWVNRVQHKITGKQTGPYEVSYEIELPDNDTGPWLIRMRRITQDYDSTAANQCLTYFSRITETYDQKLMYSDTAVFAAEIDSSQFSSSADFQFDVNGKLINYPSNYNPTTRIYTGLWDGTFSFGYCNNPAWVFMDLLMNPRYGLNVPAAYIDKWWLYSLAQYNDGTNTRPSGTTNDYGPNGKHGVHDGKGGFEPRFTFNGTLYTAEDAYRVLQMVASLMRAVVYYGAGSILIRQDGPRQVVRSYTPANIIGNFSYSSTSRTARHNSCVVRWSNPSRGYETDYTFYEDRAAIIKHGRNLLSVDGFATKSDSQAYRQAKWLVLSEQLQKETVTIEAGMDSLDVLPGDLIEVADPHMSTADFAGRLYQTQGNNLLPACNFYAGNAYKSSSYVNVSTTLYQSSEPKVPNFALANVNAANANTCYVGMPTYGFVANTDYIASAYVTVAPGQRFVCFGTNHTNAIGSALFDVELGKYVFLTDKVKNAGIVQVYDNVYRVWIKGTARASGNFSVTFAFYDGRVVPVDIQNSPLTTLSYKGTESLYVGGFMLETAAGKNGPSRYEVATQPLGKFILDRNIVYNSGSYLGVTYVDGVYDDIEGISSNTGRPARRKMQFQSSAIVSYDAFNRIVQVTDTPTSSEDDKITPMVWVYSSATIAPKPYIVLTNDPDDKGATTKITALEYSEEKLVQLDEFFNVNLDDNNYTHLPYVATCPAVEKLRCVIASTSVAGNLVSTPHLSWMVPSDYPFVAYYTVSYLSDDGIVKTKSPIYSTSIDIPDCAPGVWTFKVHATNIFGVVGPDSTVSVDVTENADLSRPRVTSLTTELGGLEFGTENLRMVWLSTSINTDATTKAIYTTFIRSAANVSTDSNGTQVTSGSSTNSSVTATISLANPYAPTITLAGTVQVDDTLVVHIGPTQFSVVSSSTSITILAEQVRAAIDADARYAATRSGNVITITFSTSVVPANALMADTDPNFRRYRIEICDPNTSALLRTDYSNIPEYVYSFAANTADFGTPSRNVKVRVYVEYKDATVSAYTEANFYNNVPTPPAVTFSPSPSALTMQFAQPTDQDYAGVELYLSTTSGFTPGSGTLVFKGLGNPVVPVTAGETLYAKYRFFDKFGTTGVSYSTQSVIVVPTMGEAIYVNGEPLQDIIDSALADITTNANTLMAYTYNSQTLLDYVDARIYVDGNPVNGVVGGITTTISNEQSARIAGDNALAQTISLIGAANSAGTAFILDTSKVKVDSTTSMADKFNTVTASLATATDSFNTLNASVETFTSAIVEAGTGALATATLRLNADGHIVGYKATNDGTVGAIVFAFDAFNIVNPATGVNLFTAAGNIVKMHNVEVDTIKVGTLYQTYHVAYGLDGATVPGTGTRTNMTNSDFDFGSYGFPTSGAYDVIVNNTFAPLCRRVDYDLYHWVSGTLVPYSPPFGTYEGNLYYYEPVTGAPLHTGAHATVNGISGGYVDLIVTGQMIFTGDPSTESWWHSCLFYPTYPVPGAENAWPDALPLIESYVFGLRPQASFTMTSTVYMPPGEHLFHVGWNGHNKVKLKNINISARAWNYT